MKNIKKFLNDRLLTGTAIYVGDDFIDVAEAKLTLRGMEVSYIQRFPVMQNIKSLSYAEAKGEIGRILEKAGRLGENKPYRVATNLRNEYFILRRFPIKDIPEAELNRAITFEAQKYVPYPMDDLTFSFRKCAKKAGNTEILFAASLSKNIDGLLEYFKDIRIFPCIIEPTPVLIARTLGLEPGKRKDKPYISLHYEPTNRVIITGIWRGYPYFFKEINILPGEDNFKTAELGYPSLKTVWGIIENDVLNTTEYIRKETKTDVEKLVISGFSVSPEESAISEDFGIPFERPSLSSFAGALPPDKDRYLATLGLLYDSLRSPLLNLAPQDMVYKDLWTYRPVAEKAAILLGIIIILHVGLGAANIIQAAKVRGVKKEFAVYKMVHPDASREEVIRYKDIMEEKVGLIDKAVLGKVYLTEKLNRLGKDITPEIWIDSINFTNPADVKSKEALKISGAVYVPGEEGVTEINNFLSRLKNDEKMMEGFEDIKLVSVKKKRLLAEEVTEFTLVLE